MQTETENDRLLGIYKRHDGKEIELWQSTLDAWNTDGKWTDHHLGTITTVTNGVTTVEKIKPEDET